VAEVQELQFRRASHIRGRSDVLWPHGLGILVRKRDADQLFGVIRHEQRDIEQIIGKIQIQQRITDP
jgi:hypothetical protein